MWLSGGVYAGKTEDSYLSVGGWNRWHRAVTVRCKGEGRIIVYRISDGKASRSYGSFAVVALIAALFSSTVEAAPRVTSVTPDPAEWIVDGRTTLEVTLTFDVDVVIPPGAVTVRTRTQGVLAGVVVTPTGSATNTATINFDVVNGDVMTVVADVSIADTTGLSLDGDGDGASGAAAVFQFTVLQGDVTRDGVVDLADLNAFVAALQSQVSDADLNGDGTVDTSDRDILMAGFDVALTATDGDAAMVTGIVSEFFVDADAVLLVTFDEVMNPETVNRFSVYALGADGSLVLPGGSPTTVDNMTFEFPFADLTCDRDFPVVVDRSATDASGELLNAAAIRIVQAEDQVPPTITCPNELFINSTTVLAIPAADVPDNADLQVWLSDVVVSDGCSAPDAITVTTSLDEPFDLPLGVNQVTFTATDFAGNANSCDALVIVVPAVAQQGTPGATGAPGSPGPAGEAGADGLACWDLNENGMADPVEDINGDGLVNVLDCTGARGETGLTGVAGPQGEVGPQGTQGPPGEPPTDSSAGQDVQVDTGTSTRSGGFCGALGMINLLWMFSGLGAMRNSRRRRYR